MTTETILGKWQTTCWKTNCLSEWKSIVEFKSGLSIWDILPDGSLLDGFGEETPERLTYQYDPDMRLFVVRRFETKECYRIEFSDLNHIVFYDLDGVEIEPDDYSFRIEMERIE